MRIIRSIRVDRGIWERAKVMLKENNQYISHFIEAKLDEYIKKKDTSEGKQDGGVSFSK